MINKAIINILRARNNIKLVDLLTVYNNNTIREEVNTYIKNIDLNYFKNRYTFKNKNIYHNVIFSKRIHNDDSKKLWLLKLLCFLDSSPKLKDYTQLP